MLQDLRNVFEKAGVANNPDFIQWFASPEIQALESFQMPDEIKRAINANLINIEAAKTHKEIRKFIKGEVLGEVDNEGILSALHELNAPEDKIREIMSAGTTAQKAKAMAKYTHELGGSAKTTASDRERKLAEQIAEQSKQFDTFKKQSEDEKNKFLNEITGVKKDYALRSVLMQHPLRDDLDQDSINLITQSKLNRFLSENKGTLVLTSSGGLEIMDAEEPTTPFFDKAAGKHVNFNDIFPKILADNKLLKVSNPDATTTTSQGNVIQKKVITPDERQLLETVQAQLDS